MIGFLLPLVMKLGIPQRFAKPFLLGAGIALLIAGFLAWDWLDDRAAVRAAQTKARAEAAEHSLRAERAANRNSEAREAERVTRSQETQEAMRHAEDANPEAARSAAGPVSRAAADRLRR